MYTNTLCCVAVISGIRHTESLQSHVDFSLSAVDFSICVVNFTIRFDEVFFLFDASYSLFAYVNIYAVWSLSSANGHWVRQLMAM